MKTIALILSLTLFSGCVPILAGVGIHEHNKAKQARQTFISNLNETNAKREASGLKPLDYCDQMYQADPRWAYNDEKCKDRYPNPIHKQTGAKRK